MKHVRIRKLEYLDLIILLARTITLDIPQSTYRLEDSVLTIHREKLEQGSGECLGQILAQ